MIVDIFHQSLHDIPVVYLNMGSLSRRDGARGNDTLESTNLDSAFKNRHEGIQGFEISYVYYVHALIDCMRFMEGIGSRRSLVQVLRVLIEGQVGSCSSCSERLYGTL